MVKAKKGSNDEDDKEKVAKWKKATESGIEGGKNKIRPNKEELSEKPDKGKQNRGGWGDHGKLKKADKIERDR